FSEIPSGTKQEHYPPPVIELDSGAGRTPATELKDVLMTHSAFPARPALVFMTPGASTLPPMPYFPQGIAAGFPSPADDHLQKKLSLDEHVVKHPAATFFAHVQGDSMRDANLFDG